MTAVGRHATRHAIVAALLVAMSLAGIRQSLAQTSPALDQALLPLFAQLPASSDLDSVKQAVAAVGRNDPATAELIAGQIADPTAKKLVRWYEFRNSKPQAGPEDIDLFRRQNPNWPGAGLRAQAEEMLLTDGEPDRIAAFFSNGKPETGAGKAALAVALLSKGDVAKATVMAADAWRNETMSEVAEAAVFARLDRLLKPADHKFRADRLLYADTQYDNIRALRIKSVQRLMSHLAPPDQAKIAARLAVYRCAHGTACLAPARRLYAKLPPEAQKDWGVFFDKALMLRRGGATQQAWRMMLQATTDPKLGISLDQWWDERRLGVYAALYDKDYQAAYRLASEHGPLSVNPLKEAEFTAGWIALRFLKDPKRAIAHFNALRDAADGPVSVSQAEYWLGRSHAQAGNAKSAGPHYVDAARFFNTYYGQIARQTIDKTATSMPLPVIPTPPGEAIQRFVNDDAIRALAIAAKAGLIDVMRALLADQKDRISNENAAVLLAHLALTLGDTQMAVKVGKSGLEKGFTGVTHYAYPTVAIPAFEPLRSLPEAALTYAIARQESEFNTLTKSSAGARGILQIMPGTARGVCSQYKLKCDVGRLMADPAYNARLATAYVADTTANFGGSYIMAIAGYNAGPGRVREWVSKIGDPRETPVDPIDWVEMLNLDETRDYVKKVMSNLQVYRAELDDPKTALQIRADLARGRSGAATAANH